MNRLMATATLGFLAGAVVGMAAGYLTAKRIVRKKMEKETEDLRKAHDELMDNIVRARASAFEKPSDEKKSSETDIYHIDHGSVIPSFIKPTSLEDVSLKKKEISHYEQKVAEFYGSSNEAIPDEKHIRILSDDEILDYDDFDSVTLIYYRDGVVADEEYVIVDDVEDQIGHRTLSLFREDGDSVLYVLNSRNKTVYEILWSAMSYVEDIVSERPYLRLPKGEDYI